MKIHRFSRRHLLAGLLLVCAGVGGARLAFPPREPPRVITAAAVVGDIEDSVLASGSIKAFDQVSVGAQVSGQLKSLKVTLGQDVKKGDLIAEIDSLAQQNALRNAEAGLENVNAQKRAQLANLRLAEQTLERQQTMLARDAASRGDTENAEAVLAATRANIAALDAQIRQAVIAVDSARLNLGYTRITAPIDGKVVAIVALEGQTLNANQSAPTIIKLARLDKVTVKAQISEADVTRVEPGQRAYFTILGEPGKRYSARLRAVEPAPDSISDTGTTGSTTSSTSSTSSAIYYNGLLDVPNPDGKLRISMTVELNIVLAEARQVLTIPSTALGPRGADGSDSVRVLDAEQHLVRRTVRIGLNNKVSAQVLGGLAAGERVVIGEATASTDAASGNSRPGPPPMMSP